MAEAGDNRSLPSIVGEPQGVRAFNEKLRSGEISPHIPSVTYNALRRGGKTLFGLIRQWQQAKDNPKTLTELKKELGGLRGISSGGLEHIERFIEYLDAVDNYLPNGVEEGFYHLKDFPKSFIATTGVTGGQELFLAFLSDGGGGLGRVEVSGPGLKYSIYEQHVEEAYRFQAFVKKYFGLNLEIQIRKGVEDKQLNKELDLNSYLNLGRQLMQSLPEIDNYNRRMREIISSYGYLFDFKDENVSISTLERLLELIFGINAELGLQESNRSKSEVYLHFYYYGQTAEEIGASYDPDHIITSAGVRSLLSSQQRAIVSIMRHIFEGQAGEQIIKQLFFASDKTKAREHSIYRVARLPGIYDARWQLVNSEEGGKKLVIKFPEEKGKDIDQLGIRALSTRGFIPLGRVFSEVAQDTGIKRHKLHESYPPELIDALRAAGVRVEIRARSKGRDFYYIVDNPELAASVIRQFFGARTAS